MNRIRNKNGTFKSLHGGDQERVLKCMYAIFQEKGKKLGSCLLYTSPSPRD